MREGCLYFLSFFDFPFFEPWWRLCRRVERASLELDEVVEDSLSLLSLSEE